MALLERARNRLGYLELRHQENLEQIVQFAAAEKPENVNDEPVNRDWLGSFFGSAQDVGDEHMQQIWARLLAGEVGPAGDLFKAYPRNPSPDGFERGDELRQALPLLSERITYNRLALGNRCDRQISRWERNHSPMA